MLKYSLIFLHSKVKINLIVNSGVHAKQEAYRRKICIAPLRVVLEVLLSSDKREVYLSQQHTLTVALRDIQGKSDK